MSNPIARYQKLGFIEALSTNHYYPIACKDLSLIIRQAYLKLPKNLQSVLFQDTLTAFRLLPGKQTRSAVSAAHLLVQSAEAAFPKQRKNLAVAEFKHAKVAYKRRHKAPQEEEYSDTTELPQDVLLHTFSFLDFHSLVSVSLVCWSWNFAASNYQLWQSQYATIFGSKRDSLKTTASLDWKEAFKKMYLGNSSKRLASNRGYCSQCATIVWLDNMKCCNGECRNQQIVPMSSHQVVEYLLNGSSSILSSSSDSDSDSDEGSVPRLWAYPKHIA